MSDNYNNMIVLLDSLYYNNHNWMICGDLKVIYYSIYSNNYNYLKCFIILIYTFVDSRHTFGYAIWVYQILFGKYPCFLCKWDSRAVREHYYRRIWPEHDNLHPCLHNISQNSLVNPNGILLPSLQIKLGIMKIVIKALDKMVYRYCIQCNA